MLLKAVLPAAVVLLLHAGFAQPQQLNDSLATGISLVDGQTLVSAQGIFMLGFFSNGDNAYLGIWYKDMKPQTIVWVANRAHPIKGRNGSLTFSTSSLDLLDRRGDKVWSTGTFNTNSPQARLLDSGNLIINDSVSGSLLWQGFDQPCDTLLPGMRIGYDIPTLHQSQLTSWKSDSDPSSGGYSIKLDQNRLPDILLFHGSNLNYRAGAWNGQGFSGLPALKNTNKLVFNMTVDKDRAYYSFSVLDSSVLWRFVVSSDGHAHRWHSNSSNGWVEYWHLPQDQCDDYAYCGPNAACYNGDCVCLQEKDYVPKLPSDWNQRSYKGGCVRSFSCASSNGFVQMSHVKLPDTLNCTKISGKSLDDCRRLCLSNCTCSAYTILGESDCVVWSGDLVDIVQLTEGINDLYARVSHDSSSVHTDRNIAVIVSVSIIGVLFAICAIIGFCYCRRQQKHSPPAPGSEYENLPQPKLAVPFQQTLDLNAIRAATNNFAEGNSIVTNRSRTVYKGTIPSVGDIAVKRLNMEAGLEELQNEVNMLARLDHPNIVKMLGSSIGNEENLICYKYMPAGSLGSVLFDEDEMSGVLDWPSRFRIIQGISEGLLYLNEDCRIIHRDIDPSNILLSEGFIPKISDFGLATLLPPSQSEGKTENFSGTRGYSAPELLYGKYSAKSDVYSFGIVLLEIVTGCKATPFSKEDADDLPRYVRLHWTQGNVDQLKDPRMGEAPRWEVERCLNVGLRCVQDEPTMRPTMSYVKSTLAAIRSVP